MRADFEVGRVTYEHDEHQQHAWKAHQYRGSRQHALRKRQCMPATPELRSFKQKRD
jgi:hypothetical protein